MIRLGITLGDPAGIGPEILVKSLARWPAAGDDGEDSAQGCAATGAGRAGIRLVLFGDRLVLASAATACGLSLPDCELREVSALTVAESQPGRGGPACGAAQVAYLEAAVRAAAAGEIDALCTAPMHKAEAQAVGFAFPGHTEFLATRLGSREVAMMFAGPRLRVALATIHERLADVPRRLDTAAVERALRLLATTLRRDFGIDRPRIAVAGLNPHAGEDGSFGAEERTVILPAIEQAATRLRGLGVAAELGGPFAADTVFRRALDGQVDAVVAMYHDQGMIPVKLIDFDDAVNLTLGLPIVRTSPAHGTARDIAGTGRAREHSMLAALRLAALLAERRACAILPAGPGATHR